MAFSKQALGLGIGVSGVAFKQPVTSLPALYLLKAASFCTHQHWRVRHVAVTIQCALLSRQVQYGIYSLSSVQRQPAPPLVLLCVQAFQALQRFSEVLLGTLELALCLANYWTVLAEGRLYVLQLQRKRRVCKQPIRPLATR